MRCIIIDSDSSSLEITESYLKKIEEIELIQKFDHALDAIPLLNKGSIDLILLDVDKHYLLGIDLAKKKRLKAQFILTISQREFGLDAYKLNATDYLVKPISLPSLKRAICKAKKRCQSEQTFSVNIFSAGPEYIKSNK